MADPHYGYGHGESPAHGRASSSPTQQPSPPNTFGGHSPPTETATELGPAASPSPQPRTPPTFVLRGVSPVESDEAELAWDEGRGNPSPSASVAAIAYARRQRISANPPLPDRPYAAPPLRPITPIGSPAGSAAASTAALAASSVLATPSSAMVYSSAGSSAATAGGSSSSQVGASTSTIEISPPPPVHRSMSRASSRAVSRAESRSESRAESRGPSRTGSRAAMLRTSDEEPPLTPGGGLDLDMPRYAFLNQDPSVSRADSPASGRNNARQKHLSGQSAYSAYSDWESTEGGSSNGHNRFSTASRPFAAFAGGPPPAWGRRDSTRSLKSIKSIRSVKSLRRKRQNAQSPSHAGPSGGGGDFEDEEDLELWALVRRAAILERLLRAGKRASNIASRNTYRFSVQSASTHYTSHTSRYGRTSAQYDRPRAPSRSGSTPPNRNASQASSSGRRRSGQSTGSTSLRTRLARRLGRTRQFTGLNSDEEDDVDPADLQTDEGHNSRAVTPHTPPRRALSTSFTRPQAERQVTPPPGAGMGVIVFPELAALPPLGAQPIKRNGELVSQSCLPPSVAVPHNPLPLPPPGDTQASRSFHSLRNLRWLDEKHPSGQFSQGTAPHASTATFGTAVFGDVPSCDDRFKRATVRRVKILVAVGCIIGIIVITGLLAGLLSARQHRDNKAEREG
ncbi:hypothetical protein Q8F55_006705 [Vanrija albida]|uniref:Uncharacterized protein n=1 Tax=Vanrija albida TaxID=181172 RepID=A0ABR3PXV6_9TREE